MKSNVEINRINRKKAIIDWAVFNYDKKLQSTHLHEKDRLPYTDGLRRDLEYYSLGALELKFNLK